MPQCEATSSKKLRGAKERGEDPQDPAVRASCRCERMALKGSGLEGTKALCYTHGSAPQLKARNALHLARQEAKHFLESEGRPIPDSVDLVAELERAVAESLEYKRYMAQKVAEIEATGERLDYRDRFLVDRLRSLVLEYRQAAKDANEFMLRVGALSAMAQKMNETDMDREVKKFMHCLDIVLCDYIRSDSQRNEFYRKLERTVRAYEVPVQPHALERPR